MTVEYPSSLSSNTSHDIATQAPQPMQALETIGFLLKLAMTSAIFDGSICDMKFIVKSDK